MAGKKTALDIGITSVTATSYINYSKDKLLYCANQFYNHKINKYNKYILDNQINRNSINYQPFIAEDGGGFHATAIKFIKRVATLRATNMDIDRLDSINYCFRKISRTLQKANAISLMNHYAIF
eukprot:168039_1